MAIMMAVISLTGQVQKPWVTPRTSWGDPDLTGLWPTTAMVGVPLERDPALGTRNTLTDDEFDQRQQLAQQQRDVDNGEFHPSEARPAAGPELAFRLSGQLVDNPVAPPPHWLEPGTPSRQASLLVDPPNGRFPPFTLAGTQRAAALTARRTNPGSLADRSLYIRCISRPIAETRSCRLRATSSSGTK